jgi:hypothetical protein
MTKKKPSPAVKDAEKTNYVGSTTKIQAAARALMRELGGSANVGNIAIWNGGDQSEPMIQTKYQIPKLPDPPAPEPPPTIAKLARALVEKLVDTADAPFHSLGISYEPATDRFTIRWLSANEMTLPTSTEEKYESLRNSCAKAFANSMYGKFGAKD